MAGPRSISCQTRSSLSALSSARRVRLGSRRPAAPAAVVAVSGSSPRARRAERAAFTPATGARPRPCRSRAPGVASSGAASHAQARNSAGTASQTTRPPRIAIARSAKPRQRSSRCSAITIAASKSSLSRRSKRDQLVAGDRVELRGRLVEQDQLRPARERGAERHALKLAPGQLGGRAVEQMRDSERERRLLDRARDRGRRLALVLERERQLGADRAHHDLRLGILEQRPDGGRERARTVLAGVHPRERSRGRRTRRREMRHEPIRGAQQRRLARARPAGEHDQLARGDVERDVGDRRRGRARIGVGDLAQRQDAHGPIPLRSANGSSAHSTIATATAAPPMPTGADSDGSELERDQAGDAGSDRERHQPRRPRPPNAMS